MPPEQPMGTGQKLLRPADLPDTFTRSLYKIAPYRGCGHGCRYCDGRAERYYVEGDFERDIEVRSQIPARLKQELPRIRERGIIGFGSGVTDSYQPLESREEISGRCARILAESPAPLPALVMTKSALPLRDLDFWKRVNEKAGFILLASITSLDEDLRSCIEPGAANIKDRLNMLRCFKAAGCATGVLAMPFLPGISDKLESISALYEACVAAGVDYIMPGGLTLRPGRQKQCYLDAIQAYRPSVYAPTLAIYCQNRVSGSPTRVYSSELSEKLRRVQNEFGIPYLLPYSRYSRLLPQHDALRVLFRDMIELYCERKIDTSPLRHSADRYDSWLVSLRRIFRRRRSLPPFWIEERFAEAVINEELRGILENPRLEKFVYSLVREGASFNYTSLRLEDKK